VETLGWPEEVNQAVQQGVKEQVLVFVEVKSKHSAVWKNCTVIVKSK